MQSNQSSPISMSSDDLSVESGFTSTMPGGESSNRRQRISMACQYCRHRKIKCCGSAPCANCTRAHRTCDYTPVPEEVNRATREKKAAAKAAKVSHSQFSSPHSTYSPYFVDQPTFSPSPVFLAPSHVAGPGPIRAPWMQHRRSLSTPNLALPPYSPIPPAPVMSSPAQLESNTYMWSTGPSIPSTTLTVPALPMETSPMTTYPSVLQPQPQIQASPIPQQQFQFQASPVPSPMPQQQIFVSAPSTYVVPSTPSPTSTVDSMGSSYLAPATTFSTPTFSSPMQGLAISTPPESPASFYPTPTFTYTPQPFPFSPSPLSQATFTTASPTLAPELKKDALVGLGLGMPVAEETYYTPVMAQDEYMTSTWVKSDAIYL